MNRQQLRIFFSSLGIEPFRADQVMKWMYHSYCDNFDCMTNIKKDLREKLKCYSEIRAPVIVNQECSHDGTVKWSFKVGNQEIETVYIPENTRATLCISSQVGCALKCTFCSTGKHGFSRNLLVSEIIGQIWSIAKMINVNQSINLAPVTNVVIMGMGEPLLNFNNIVTAIQIMLDDFGFGLSKHRITLSTSGIVPAINKLADMVIGISLAISLHAPNDFIRNQIMPINKKWNINDVIKSVKYYLSKLTVSRRIVTIEYIMLDHINDCVNCANQLIQRLRGIPCKVNLIPWNIIPYSSYRSSSEYRINKFSNILSNSGLFTTIRKTRGADINAACGQLVGIVINKKNEISNFNK